MSFMPETTAQPEVRQTEIATEFERVHVATKYITEMAQELEQRLSLSILAQRKEGAADSAKHPEPLRVPLAQSLYEHGTTLEQVREHLSSILNRLEA